MLQTEVAAVVKETLTTLRVNPSVAKDGSSGAPITLGPRIDRLVPPPPPPDAPGYAARPSGTGRD